jgi:hypothetical protein
MKFLFQFPVYMALVTLMYSCDQPGIKKDMVQFDKAYVPVFYYVYKNELGKASQSMFLLDARWQQFQNKYQNQFGEDLDGMERLRYIDGWLSDANDAILRDDQYAALVQLDHIKYEMMEIRRSFKIEYFLDYLWDFEGALSMLSESSCEDNNLVCSADELAFLINETQFLWEMALSAESSPFSKVFNKKEITLFKKYKKEVSENMKLVEAQKYGSHKKLETAVDKTFDSFLNLLTLFGDFDSASTFYADNLQR